MLLSHWLSLIVPFASEKQKMTMNVAKQMSPLSGLHALGHMLFAHIRVIERHTTKLDYFFLFHSECLNGNQNEKSEEDKEAYNSINFYIQNTAERFFKHSYFFTGLFVMSTPNRWM